MSDRIDKERWGLTGLMDVIGGVGNVLGRGTAPAPGTAPGTGMGTGGEVRGRMERCGQ